jgi:hypothetical protein
VEPEDRAALAIRRDLAEADPDDPGVRDGLADARTSLADTLRRLGRGEEARDELDGVWQRFCPEWAVETECLSWHGFVESDSEPESPVEGALSSIPSARRSIA